MSPRTRTPIRPEDIYEIRQPFQCRLAPGGDRLVTAVSQPDRKLLKNLSHLWMLRLDARSPGKPAVSAARRSPASEDGPSPACAFTQGNHNEQNPRWSPDGRRIGFLSNRSGKGELWIIPSDGGEAHQLTRLEGNVSDFTWSPDGRRLAVIFTAQDPEAKEREEKKKRGDPGSEAPRVREIRRLFYKLDGTGFLPVGRSHLWIVDAETGRARQLTSDERYDEGEPRFSPDGKGIIFSSNRSRDPDLLFQRVDLWRIPARGGAIEKIRTFDGPSVTPSISPDGQWIAFTGTPDPDAPWNQHHVKLWLVPAAGGRPIELTERLDRSCELSTISDTFGLAGAPPPIWSPDSAWIYFGVTNEGNSEVWRVSRRDRRPEPVLSRPGAVIDYSIDFANRWIYSAWSETANPGEIRRDPLPEAPSPGARGRTRPAKAEPAPGMTLSRFNADWLSRREIAEPEEIWIEGRDGNRIQGWILNPKRLRTSHPGVLYIHGGPATQYGRIFFHEFQVLAAAGYVVFYCNPRGGTGYSERHLNTIIGRWGTKDYDDLMDFADVVFRRVRHLDRRRIAVAGGSYGGFMTNWIIGHTDRFACAVSSRSISNFMSFVGSSDVGYSWPQEFNTTGPWEDPRGYLRMSPLNYLSRMKTPTLIEHQEEDHRCPIEQAEQLWAALKVKGVPVEFLRYPAEPHGMSRGGRPDRRIDRLERILDWIGRWTKPRRR